MKKMTKKQIRRACTGVLLWQRENQAPDLRLSTLTPAERAFMEKALGKGAQIYRHGWPDFLIALDGGAKFVEVKRDGDTISARQQRAFEALEKHTGLHVWIWDLKKPEKLTPWRKYEFMA
jgi:hypothetical protein